MKKAYLSAKVSSQDNLMTAIIIHFRSSLLFCNNKALIFNHEKVSGIDIITQTAHQIKKNWKRKFHRRWCPCRGKRHWNSLANICPLPRD